MSSNTDSVCDVAVSALQYRDIAGNAVGEGVHPVAMDERLGSAAGRRAAERTLGETEMAARVARERTEAAAQAEQKMRHELEQKLVAARAPVAQAIREFAEQRDNYFTKVEAEIVQLALAIAAKILHREAQVDPMLVATLVRMAVERMREESGVTVRVGAGRAATWAQHFAGHPKMAQVEIVEDAQLGENDCILQTELGAANFGLEAQLKEVEQGFFDLLALRPAGR